MNAGVVITADAESPAGASLPTPDRYRNLVEGALLAIYVSRPDGRLVSCNTAFARMLGFASIADAVATGTSQVYADDGERERLVERVRADGRLEHHRARLRRRGGEIIDVVETIVGQFADGELVELCGFLIDVTAGVEAEAALVERGRQFRAAFLDAADAMLILDDERGIVEANPAACTLFNLTTDALVNRPLDGLMIGSGDELATIWRELLALGEAKRDQRVRTANGDARLVECSYRARVHGHHHLCIARDVTDRRFLEERLIQSEKIESVGRLAGGIAHDFNNLLTAILGYTELLISHHPVGDPDRSDLDEIQKAGQRAAALTQQLLASSREASATTALTNGSAGTETILLVEDEDALRVVVSAVLKRQGYRVLEASTPSAACEIFGQSSREIDLLVTDVVMPEMHGPALAQRLVGLRPELRVVFISGYADLATSLDSHNPNLSFVSKPFQASTLSERVREMLSRPGRSQDAR